MAQTKHEIQSLLAQAGGSPRRRFGQNFMIDQNLVRLIADAGRINPGELIIEVGPGTGTLTEELLARGANLLAVEIDRDLAAMLQTRMANQPNYRLMQGDALAGKHAVHPDLLQAIQSARGERRPIKLVANLPYNIASPLVIELLIAGVDLLAFTVQKEVADRLRAEAGSEEYGPLSVMAQMLSRVEILRTMPPQAFWPMPKVDSALVRMERQDRLGEYAAEFGRFVHQLFSARRKTLRRALLQAELNADALLGVAGLMPTMRPEELSPEKCWELFGAIDRDR